MRLSRRTLLVSGILFVFVASAFNLGSGAAKTRQDVIFNFLNENQMSDGGFKESNTTGITSNVHASFASIATIERLGKVEEIKDKDNAFNYMNGRFSESLSLKNTANMYYALKGVKLLDESIESNTTTAAGEIYKSLRNNVTYGYKNTGDQIENIMATYFAVEFFHESLADVVSKDETSDFVLSCYDSVLGGFGASPGLGSTPVDTYYALKILERMDKISSLTDAQKTALIGYLESFYVNDKNLPLHYGGYSLSTKDIFSTLLMTYYCVGGLKVLGASLHTEETTAFILNRQSPQDFGFQDINEKADNSFSSAIQTYYAVESLFALNGEQGFDKVVKADLWQLEINPWILAAIIIGSVGGVIIICIVIWKLKNQM